VVTVTELHIPEYGIHECVPTQDAYDSTVRALEKHRQRADAAEAQAERLHYELAAIRDLAFRGVGSPADALQGIHERACRALNEVT
jgi:hypothetical protein